MLLELQWSVNRTERRVWQFPRSSTSPALNHTTNLLHSYSSHTSSGFLFSYPKLLISEIRLEYALLRLVRFVRAEDQGPVLQSRINSYPGNFKVNPVFKKGGSLLTGMYRLANLSCKPNLLRSRWGSRLEISRCEITAYWPINSPENVTVLERSSSTLSKNSRRV